MIAFEPAETQSLVAKNRPVRNRTGRPIKPNKKNYKISSHPDFASKKQSEHRFCFELFQVGLPSVGEFHPVKAFRFCGYPAKSTSRFLSRKRLKPPLNKTFGFALADCIFSSRKPLSENLKLTAGGELHSAPKIPALFYNLFCGLSSKSHVVF